MKIITTILLCALAFVACTNTQTDNNQNNKKKPKMAVIWAEVPLIWAFDEHHS